MSAALGSYLFYEIAALLVLAAVVGYLGLLARQPLIVSFIAVGILSGPSALGIARSDASIDLLSELGIAVLLFLVGLKLDLKLVRSLGRVALLTGLGQVAFTTAFGFLIALALGFGAVPSLYIAVALTFSSTIIIVKLLSDKREIDSLHGRIALGFLIVQDLVVVLAMIVLSAMGIGAQSTDALWDVLRVFAYGLAMLAGVWVFVRYLANPLVQQLARSPELLVSFVIGWAALLAALGHFLGFGKELGGLLAGVSLASTPVREAIASRLASLRDFLLLFFFIALGASLDLSLLGAYVPAALVLSAFVLIGNPLVVLVIMGLLGYRKRTGFLAGLTVAQISEFSLIFMAMGVSLGHVEGNALGLVTLVGLVTITLSTYMITYSHEIYGLLEPVLGIFERRESGAAERREDENGEGAEVVLFGLGRFGLGIARNLRRAGHRVLGIDFDPEAVRKARREGFDVLFGDATDPEFLAHVPLRDARWVVAAIPWDDASLVHGDPRGGFIRALEHLDCGARIAVTAPSQDEPKRLHVAGADLVLMPFRDAAARAAALLAEEPPQEGSGSTTAQNPKELAL